MDLGLIRILFRKVPLSSRGGAKRMIFLKLPELFPRVE
jgi:hypothetical protein